MLIKFVKANKWFYSKTITLELVSGQTRDNDKNNSLWSSCCCFMAKIILMSCTNIKIMGNQNLYMTYNI